MLRSHPSLLAAGLVSLVACMGGCASGEPGAQPPGSGWFVDASERVGLAFVHDAGARGAFELPEIMGAGAALFDQDGDGDLDIYLINGGRGDAVNRLYRQDPDGNFIDVTTQSGLGDRGYGMGVAIGDYDNDGRSDVYVTNHGPDRLYRNTGNGRFVDATAAAGIEVDGWSCSATFFDADRDGHLDLFVTRYVADDPDKRCADATGRPDYCSPDVFPPVPDVFLHNNGDGTFRDASGSSGIDTLAAPGLGVVAEDLDGDGWTDVYVANDGAANHLWINRRDGTFSERALVTGAAYNLEGRAEASMGAVAADLDGDLHLDLFLSHLAGETNTLYLSRGAGGGFQDATAASGLAGASLAVTGFGAVAVDVELDGDLDLMIVNGRVVRGRAPAGALGDPPWDEFAESNLVFLNDGTGRFAKADEVGRAFTSPVEVSRGLASGDVDGDGDIDVLVTNAQGRARLYLNEAPRRGGWLAIRAIDPATRRDAIGAVITLVAGDRRAVRTINRGYSYLSSSQPRARFATGSDGEPTYVDVRWPGGPVERFPVPGTDREITVTKGEGGSPG